MPTPGAGALVRQGKWQNFILAIKQHTETIKAMQEKQTKCN